MVLVCLLVLFGGPAASARAYVCSPPSTRTLTAHKDCARPAKAHSKRADADPMSFVFFLGIVVVVVLFPVALGRREELPPE